VRFSCQTSASHLWKLFRLMLHRNRTCVKNLRCQFLWYRHWPPCAQPIVCLLLVFANLSQSITPNCGEMPACLTKLLCNILQRMPLTSMSSACCHWWLCVLLPVALPLAKVVPSRYHNDSLTVVLALPITLPLAKVFLSPHQHHLRLSVLV
jgi:hypothetical protein